MKYSAKRWEDLQLHSVCTPGSNGGFTLVELIVVLTLMTILITFSAFGVVSWQRSMRYSEANSYASEIFMAAQNSLTRMSSNGELEKLKARVDTDTALSSALVPVLSVTDDRGNLYGLNATFPAFSEKIYSFSCSKGDYDTFLSGGYVSPQAEILFALISSRIYDKSILNNSICVECTLESGQVFWALYDEFAEGFEYNYANKSHVGIVDICDRLADTRMEKNIGAYFVDTLYSMPTREASR